MDSHINFTKEEKLKSLLGQLEVECGIFERIVYKNKNQHRRSSYFQYLLKVRRDLRLLKSANLEELLTSCFLVITGKRPKQKVQLLESLKRRRYDVGKPSARLLSQIVEPMLRPATQVSTLLARSFFMGFSLTVFSLLARLRVLVQQILLDIVLVFNTVSYLSQTKHSVKLNHQGLEVFREFYPKEEDYVTLECAWNTDKFILVERTNTCEIEMQEGDSDGEVSGGNEMRYKTIESVLGDNEPTAENADAERSPHMNEATTDVIMDGNDEDKKQVEHFGEEVDNIVVTDNPRKKNASRASSLADTGTSAGTGSLILTTNARKVAFVSVKRPSSSTANPTDIPSKETGSNGGDKTDAFYSLLTCGNLNDSLFG